LEEAVNVVNLKWSTAPFVQSYLDPSVPAEWPDPWTLLAENYYCDIAKSLGMLYTLYFTKHKDVKLQLDIYSDLVDQKEKGIVLVNDGEFILNYAPFKTVNITQLDKTTMVLQQSLSPNDLKLNKY